MKFLWAIRGKNVERFLLEVERAAFLLDNLNKNDPKDPLTATYIRVALAQKNIDSKFGEPSPALIAAQALYAAWSAVSIKYQKAQALGWEMDSHTEFRIQRANDHLFERVFDHLTVDAQNVLAFSLPMIYAAVKNGQDFWASTVSSGNKKQESSDGIVTRWSTGVRANMRWDKVQLKPMRQSMRLFPENTTKIIDFTALNERAEQLSPFAA